jgi:hypothetical protein
MDCRAVTKAWTIQTRVESPWPEMMIFGLPRPSTDEELLHERNGDDE